MQKHAKQVFVVLVCVAVATLCVGASLRLRLVAAPRQTHNPVGGQRSRLHQLPSRSCIILTMYATPERVVAERRSGRAVGRVRFSVPLEGSSPQTFFRRSF
jgi:hypothetical protein